eukprot:GFUD01019978.1.p1 GENE.GFUD01019978.1~~GFUD01019978.1.p1  ORF type:complete len:438 (+),score=130.16 GFUD01019978.1:57-1370(+)
MGSDSSGTELLQLQWNSYSSSWHAALSTLRTTGQFCDLTLVVDDGHLPAHRVVVSSCSPLLSRALAVCHHPHPAVVLRGVNMVQMKGILDFMYMGEARVDQPALESFLKAAEELSVMGLSEAHEESFEQHNVSMDRNGFDASQSNINHPKSKISPSNPLRKSKKVDGEIKSKKTKRKKMKKDCKDSEQQDESVVIPSPDVKQGYESSSPLFKKPKLESNEKYDEGEFAEPEIVFKKGFDESGNQAGFKNAEPPKTSDERNEEITITITPPKKKTNTEDANKSFDSNSDTSIKSGGDQHSTPKRKVSPGGLGPSALPTTSSPSKFSSPNEKTWMTNLPHDRAKLRDIWDTLVASEEIEGEVVYSCLCCEKTFRGKSAKSNAWSHVDHNHTPQIEHKCHMCDFTSKSNDGISRHISKIHKKDQAKKEEQKIEEEMIVLD